MKSNYGADVVVSGAPLHGRKSPSSKGERERLPPTRCAALFVLVVCSRGETIGEQNWLSPPTSPRAAIAHAPLLSVPIFFVGTHAYRPRHARSQNQQRVASLYGAAVELQVRFRFLALRVWRGWGSTPFSLPSRSAIDGRVEVLSVRPESHALQCSLLRFGRCVGTAFPTVKGSRRTCCHRG